MLRAVATPSYNAVIGSPKSYKANPKIAILGDSMTYQNNDCAGTKQLINENQGHMTWLNALSGHRFNFPVAGANDIFTAANFGVSGEMLDEIKARLNPVIAYNPDAVIFMGGTNDLVNTTRTWAQMTADAQTIIETFTSRGILFIAMPILPRSVWSSLTAGEIITRRKVQYNFNTWLRRYALTNPLCVVADPTLDWIDSASATGDPKAGITKDSLHPSPTGAYYMAKAIKRVMDVIFPPICQTRVSSVLDAYDETDNPRGNHTINGLMSGTAGTNGAGSSGVVSDNWTVSRSSGSTITAVCSKTTMTIPDVLTPVPAQRIVVASGGAGSANEAIRIYPSATISTGIVTGEVCYAEAIVRISSITGVVQGIALQTEHYDGSVSHLARDMDRHTSPHALPTGIDEVLTLKTPVFPAPASFAYVRCGVLIYVDGSVSGGVTADIAQITLRKVV